MFFKAKLNPVFVKTFAELQGMELDAAHNLIRYDSDKGGYDIKHDISEGELTGIYVRATEAHQTEAYGNAIKKALRDAKAEHDELLLSLLENPSPVEMKTWAEQRSEASAILAGTADHEVTEAAQNRLKEGERLEEWAAKVMLVRVPYTKHCESKAIGILRRTEARIEAIGHQVGWEAALKQANDTSLAEAEQAVAAAQAKLEQLKTAALAAMHEQG